jgi:hypothetical protein
MAGDERLIAALAGRPTWASPRRISAARGDRRVERDEHPVDRASATA